MDWGCLLFCIVFSISTSAGSAACLQRVPVLKQCSEMSLLLPPFVLPGKKKKKKSGPRRQSRSAPALRSCENMQYASAKQHPPLTQPL